MEINKPVATIIIFIITLILVFLFVLPAYQESRRLDESLVKKQIEYSGKSAYYREISELLANIQARQEVLEKIDSALPADFSLASLVSFLSKKAVETGSLIKSVIFLQASPGISGQPSLTASKKEVKQVVFNVDLLGNYQGLKNFLFALEKSARLFEINTISFASLKPLQSAAAARTQQQTYDFKLQIKTNSY